MKAGSCAGTQTTGRDTASKDTSVALQAGQEPAISLARFVKCLVGNRFFGRGISVQRVDTPCIFCLYSCPILGTIGVFYARYVRILL